MKYLDPKADMTFKKVFGEHEDLVISFLNSLLPFESEDEIKSVEYLNPELVPLNPLKKDSIVDVRCKDSRGRQFIVEMQMMWTSEYKQRVLFNASKAYVSQLECGQDYDLLHPVYSLNMVNDIYSYDLLHPVYSLNMVNDIYSDSEDYYHDYRIVEIAETNEVIEGLRFIFIELPKFTPKNYGDKKMQVLWLRYLTEINSRTRAQLEVSAFSDAQLLGYDRFWDMVSTAKMQISSSRKEGFRRGHKEGLETGMKEGLEKGMKEGMEKGLEEGMKEGMEQGMKQGKKEGMREERIKNARGMKAEGIADEIIARVTGLTPEEITALQ